MLTSCGDGGGGDQGTEEDPYSIGIAQPVEHPSLDATREGFKAAFEEADVAVEWTERNAQGDAATESTVAGQLAEGDHDLLATIATSQSQQIVTATQGEDTPVVFMAVTEPEEAGLVDSWEEPGANVTGLSDLNPVEEQLGLITEADPDVETIGILYASGEVNSEVQVELAQEASEELGVDIETSTITNSSEVQQGVESLSGVDAIWIPTDNVVVSGLESVISFGRDQQIPVFSADGDSVARGTIGSYAVDYEALGQQAGEMALRILEEDEEPGQMPVETLDDVQLYLNPEAAEQMGLEVPQELMDSADVVVGEDIDPEDPEDAEE